MQVFVKINNNGIMINADVNAKNPRNCECVYDKSSNVGEYLDYTSCKCRKRLIDKLFEECSENINEKILHSNEINDYEKIYNSCSLYIVFLVIFFILTIIINNILIYFYWYFKKEQYWCY